MPNYLEEFEEFGFQKTYTLEAETPHIHFQSHNMDACLRASEVKPRLDKYLIKLLERDGSDFSGWLIPQQKRALNYKLNIIAAASGQGMTIDDFKMFYGNQGIDLGKVNDAYKYKNIVFRNCTLTVTCFDTKLLDYIDRHIGDFFILHNFGTMKSKGFGSFTVNGKEKGDQYIINLLIDDAEATYCYKFNGFSQPAPRGVTHDFPKTFNAIKTVYSLLKSGVNRPNRDPHRAKYKRSILVQYAHNPKIKIGNEKAKLKSGRYVPAISTHSSDRSCSQEDRNAPNEKVRYVKGLLGVCEKLEFINDIPGADKVTVEIKCIDFEGDDFTKPMVERFASPIRFKVINNTVYFVAYKLDKKILGRRFAFSSKNYHNNQPLELQIPTQADLGDDALAVVQDFLYYAYQNYFRRGASGGYLSTFPETMTGSGAGSRGSQTAIQIIQCERK